MLNSVVRELILLPRDPAKRYECELEKKGSQYAGNICDDDDSVALLNFQMSGGMKILLSLISLFAQSRAA